MDERIGRGLRRHFDEFESRIDSGARRLGYKVAFNAPAAQKMLGIDASLVAGLTRATLVTSGQTVAVGVMKAPRLEPEIAIRLGADVAVSSSPAEVEQAVEAIAPAIELVDINLPLEGIEEVLAQGVFHRAVALGEFAPPPAGMLAGLAVRVVSDGETTFEGDAQVATGTLSAVVLQVAGVLDTCGLSLRAGDHLILGSMTAPIAAVAGGRFSVSLAGYGDVELALN